LADRDRDFLSAAGGSRHLSQSPRTARRRLYQWAKVAFDDFVAFLVAWNFWIFGILVMSGISLIIKRTSPTQLAPRQLDAREQMDDDGRLRLC
jgi:hypothetical protein